MSYVQELSSKCMIRAGSDNSKVKIEISNEDHEIHDVQIINKILKTMSTEMSQSKHTS